MTEKTTASGAADLPEALRLAAWLNEVAWHKMRLGDVLAAGRELRRLHALAASAPVAPAPQPELDEGRSQARVPLQQGEYLPLPIGEGTVYCNPDGSLMIDASLAFFDGAKIGDKLYTADQVCAAIDADRAARGAAQAAPAPASGEAMSPFGYFRAEPFGWTDCAESDEGAKPLYEAPPAEIVGDLRNECDELRRDAERYRKLRDEDAWGEDTSESGGSRWGELGEMHGAAFDAVVDALPDKGGTPS